MAENMPTTRVLRVGEEPRPERSPARPHLEPTAGVRPREHSEGRVRRRAKARLKTLRNFVMFSLRDLRPAEVNVWLAIFNCEYNGEAQIGYDRIAELTGKSKKHVGKAVNALIASGLIERKQLGKFRPGRNKGLSSIYRVHGQMKPKEEGPPANPR